MTIKKPMKAPTAAAAAPGGATIASRFQLNVSDVPARPVNGKATTFAASAGLIALAVTGILTYLLWQHWEFLMPA